MRFDIQFTRGPLDGLNLNGDTSDTDTDNSFAAECFLRSSAGSVGTIFETFDPHVLTTTGSETTTARLHHYGVESATYFSVSSGTAVVPVLVEVKAVYRGSSDRYALLQVSRQEE